MFWKLAGRRLLFLLPAEQAHYLSMGLFSTLAVPTLPLVRRWLTVKDQRLNQEKFGLQFENPVGLAAGFDKDGKWYRQLSALGFGHVEIGTITGQPQPGNPKPRLFRLTEDQAIINRMGFNNGGADQAARRLAKNADSLKKAVLGINIGKTKVVSNQSAVDDYRFSMERLFTFADYFTVNVSSPNTPGLRELQNRHQLSELLSSLAELNQQLAQDHQVTAKPILLKIAPDLTDEQLHDIVAIAQEVDIQGIIATNTTLSREGLQAPPETVRTIGAGGLSGSPLTLRSRQVVRLLYQQLPRNVSIIGVGGIVQVEDAWKMILAGASLVQVYTGFIYQGPTFVRDINRYLLKQLDHHGFESIQQAVGMEQLV